MARVFAVVIGTFLMVVATGATTGDDRATTTGEKPSEVAVGQPLPTLESTDDDAQPWKSAEHVGQKILVMYFYPGDFTGGCTRQAQAYRDELAKIEQLGAEVVGVSGDEVASHKLFKETYGLKHTLLADTSGELAKLLGVPVKAGGTVKATGPDRRPLLDANGQRINVQRAVTIDRWTVVVGRDGKIASSKRVNKPADDALDVFKIVEALP